MTLLSSARADNARRSTGSFDCVAARVHLGRRFVAMSLLLASHSERSADMVRWRRAVEEPRGSSGRRRMRIPRLAHLPATVCRVRRRLGGPSTERRCTGQVVAGERGELRFRTTLPLRNFAGMTVCDVIRAPTITQRVLKRMTRQKM